MSGIRLYPECMKSSEKLTVKKQQPNQNRLKT